MQFNPRKRRTIFWVPFEVFNQLACINNLGCIINQQNNCAHSTVVCADVLILFDPEVRGSEYSLFNKQTKYDSKTSPHIFSLSSLSLSCLVSLCIIRNLIQNYSIYHSLLPTSQNNSNFILVWAPSPKSLIQLIISKQTIDSCTTEVLNGSNNQEPPFTRFHCNQASPGRRKEGVLSNQFPQKQSNDSFSLCRSFFQTKTNRQNLPIQSNQMAVFITKSLAICHE